jgi:hypothetical protein
MGGSSSSGNLIASKMMEKPKLHIRKKPLMPALSTLENWARANKNGDKIVCACRQFHLFPAFALLSDFS